MWRTVSVGVAAVTLIIGCTGETQDETTDIDAGVSAETTAAAVAGGEPQCMLIEEGFGPIGTETVQVDEVVSGLEVPWGLAFLPNGDFFVTERPGRIRLVRDGQLVDDPVAEVRAAATGEGGLLGIAAHPNIDQNRFLYVYYTVDAGGTTKNIVERWVLSEDGASATSDQIIVDNIPASRFHNGGQIRFGPDDMLYVGTGDARNPDTAQDVNSLAGKLLRVTPDGDVPSDNPISGNPAYLLGVRNTQGFDWPNASTIWLSDHGPSGELGRSGHDEINVAQAGDNLGWPTVYGCQTESGMVAPSLTWETAVPPGGAAVYDGGAMPDWQGDLIVGTLGSRHLHRVALTGSSVQQHAVYLQGDQPDGYGRLREVMMGPDDRLYITTSNCDGRGTCPPDGDKILRLAQ